MVTGAEGCRGPEPRYLASGVSCPCARPPRRLGSPSRLGPAPGALAVWPRIQTAWCSPPLPPLPPPPSLLPSLAAAATRGSGRGERAEPGARRQLLTLGVAEGSPRGSRLRSAEQRRRLPRAEPLGPQEEKEEEEDWGSAARPHNVQGAGRRKRGTCAPRRAGRPVLAGIAERLLEWGAGGRRRGGRGSSAAQIPPVPASRRRGEEKAKRAGPPPSRPCPLLGRCRTPSRPPAAGGGGQRRRERRGSRSRSRHLVETGFAESPCPGERAEKVLSFSWRSQSVSVSRLFSSLCCLPSESLFFSSSPCLSMPLGHCDLFSPCGLFPLSHCASQYFPYFSLSFSLSLSSVPISLHKSSLSALSPTL